MYVCELSVCVCVSVCLCVYVFVSVCVAVSVCESVCVSVSTSSLHPIVSLLSQHQIIDLRLRGKILEAFDVINIMFLSELVHVQITPVPNIEIPHRFHFLLFQQQEHVTMWSRRGGRLRR